MICFPCGGSQVSGVCFYAVLSFVDISLCNVIAVSFSSREISVVYFLCAGPREES